MLYFFFSSPINVIREQHPTVLGQLHFYKLIYLNNSNVLIKRLGVDELIWLWIFFENNVKYIVLDYLRPY